MPSEKQSRDGTSPDDLGTLRSVLDRLAEHGDRPALLALHKAGIERLSYAELADQVRRLARGLAGAGVGRGDAVALLAGNRPEWVAACLAVIGAGAVVVPLDVQLADDVLGHVLKDSGVRLLFTTSEQAKRLERLDTETELKPLLLDAGADDERSWQRLLAEGAGDWPQAEPGPDDPAALFYTSGTTGLPKGVPLSHGNLAFQLKALRQAGVVTAEDRLLLPLPMHHVYPFVIGMLAPLTLGLPIVLPQALTGPQVVRTLREGEVTVVIGVPRLYRALAAGARSRSEGAGRVTAALFRAGAGLCTWVRRRLGLRLGKLLLRPLHRQLGPRLRVLVSGGAALDPDLAWELEGLGWQVATGYGLTETAPMLTLDPPGRARIGSVGRPLPGVEIRIDPSVGPDTPQGQGHGGTGPRHEEGEILARGPGVFAGYRNLPEKTREAFTADGWFRTGDLGYRDADGFLYVTGRVATRITTEGGKKFQPDDVEAAYQGSPVLREVGVLQKDGKLVAVIVPEPGAIRGHGEDLDRAVRDALNERARGLPSYEHITDYAVTREPLPRTHLGKIRRAELAERYERAKKGEGSGAAAAGPLAPEEMSDEDRALLEDAAAKQVWDWLAGRYPDRRLTPDTSPQLDLGVDSMEWLNLTLEIRQRAGVELSDEAIGRIETVRDLLREVAGQGGTGGAAPEALLERPEEALSDRQKRWLEPLGPVQAALAWGLYAMNRGLMRGLFRLRVEGLEHLPDRGPFLLAPNHVSYLDSFALAAALGYPRLRQTYWAGWTGAAFGNPLSRLFSRLAQIVPIDPQRGVVSSLALGAAVLKRGRNLVWYPEGQRSPTGALQPFKPGVGLLLAHFRVPVVPVFLHGTHEALPPGKALPRPTPITVVFGPPLDGRELEQQGEGDQPHDRIAHALHDRVAELGGAAQGGLLGEPAASAAGYRGPGR
jgi:long-chain acyl-CoA synthetase